MSENYEAIGIAVRPHDAIRLGIAKGMQAGLRHRVRPVRRVWRARVSHRPLVLVPA